MARPSSRAIVSLVLSTATAKSGVVRMSGAAVQTDSGVCEVAPTEPLKSWFGQPKGLTILFLTQMWEQFSYYGMRALLVYYMTKQLLIGQETSSLIYGTYTSLAFFTPIVGGIVSDRW